MPTLTELTQSRFEPSLTPQNRSDFRTERENLRPSTPVSQPALSSSRWGSSPLTASPAFSPDQPTPSHLSPLRIVIAENEDFSRNAVAQLCREDLGHEVVGLARHGQEAIELVRATQPDLLILDLYLSKHDGFEVAEIARCLCPKIKSVVFTAARERYTLYRIEHVGFNAYVDKNDRAVDSLRTAIESIAAGRRYYAPSLISEKKRRQADPLSFDKLLTDREREVLGLIGHCLNNEEIGALLGIAPKTAETFRHRLLKKLGMAGTPKLIRFAIDHGFTQFALGGSTGKRVFADFANTSALPSALSPAGARSESMSSPAAFASRCSTL